MPSYGVVQILPIDVFLTFPDPHRVPDTTPGCFAAAVESTGELQSAEVSLAVPLERRAAPRHIPTSSPDRWEEAGLRVVQIRERNFE